jgi:hypothetical protein
MQTLKEAIPTTASRDSVLDVMLIEREERNLRMPSVTQAVSASGRLSDPSLS